MEKIRSVLEKNLDLRDKIFCRGFYFTNDKVEIEKYPFFDVWNRCNLDEFSLVVHKKQHFYISKERDVTLALIGHAYDPIDYLSDEQEIIMRLNHLVITGEDAFWDKFNNLTGVFTLILVREGSVYVVGDPAGMQTTFYCMRDGKIYISSHTNLIGDILDLKWDSYVKNLSSYRFYPLLGNSLPGNITQFKAVKSLVPNHYVRLDSEGKIHVKRFFTPFMMDVLEEELVILASDIMKANMKLIADKWKKPAISLTGGCDSKTTLACANGIYDRFSYFSYISSEAEKVDAEAAHKICTALNLSHSIYRIPDEDNQLENISDIDEVLFWNSGGICRSNKNDVRKRAFFSDTPDFDVEVKSWASEIGRAYYSKRFHGRKYFGEKPTPRKCTTLYKFFLHDRKLVKQTDKVFERYLKRYMRQDVENPVPWQEQFFWEFRMSSWNGRVITGEHRYSFDITIPYNNRRLLTILLSASLESRINDVLYARIRESMNPAIDATGVAVKNLLHTEKRELAEELYYVVHTHLPF